MEMEPVSCNELLHNDMLLPLSHCKLTIIVIQGNSLRHISVTRKENTLCYNGHIADLITTEMTSVPSKYSNSVL